MISCSCGARLKVSDDKLTAAGVKIKCPKCATVHVARKEASETTAPAPSQPAMPWFAQEQPAERHQGGALVLIAHDSTVVAEMIAGVLRDAGMATDYAPNGLEALKKAMETKPQAMVVDVGLTGIYGFELCERLKGDKATAHIKIVLLSSVYGLTAYKRSPVTLYGADDYIEKHHIPDQLVPKVRNLLEGKKAAAPPEPAPAQEPAEQPAQRLAPLMSSKGVLRQPASASPPAAQPDTIPAKPESLSSFDIPEPPSILPKTPVTLGGAPAQSPEAPVSRPSPPPAPAPPEVQAGPEPPSSAPQFSPPESDAAAFADGSIRLDAGFFEHEEYEAPEKPQTAADADPVEVEKARRFARLIVSDIALYNQESVAEGIRNGTFFELLKEDIAEGRSLYDSRVPATVRSGKDYLQEAFDDFLASKKKLH